MIRLLLADLRQNLRSWTWTVVVALVAATSIAAQLMVGRGGRIAAEATGDANMAEGATVLTSMQLIFVGLSVVVALSTVAALVVASRARDHGLWRAQGMRPGLLRMILLGQLALVGAGSAIVAIPLAYPLSFPLSAFEGAVGIILPTARPQPHPVDLLILLILCTSLTVLGGRGAARRSSGAQIIALLREHDDVQGRSRRVRRRLLRGILIAVCLAGLIALPIIAQITESDHESIFTLVIGAGLAALVLMVVLTPRVTPALERTWTALFPSRSVAWHMARHSAAYEAGRSSATVMPFSLAIGLVGFAFGIRALGGNADVGGFIALFGTAFLVAWTGGVAVIAMPGWRRPVGGRGRAGAGAVGPGAGGRHPRGDCGNSGGGIDGGGPVLGVADPRVQSCAGRLPPRSVGGNRCYHGRLTADGVRGHGPVQRFHDARGPAAARPGLTGSAGDFPHDAAGALHRFLHLLRPPHPVEVDFFG